MTGIPNHTNGWTEYSKLVLSQLEEHGDVLKDINRELTNMRVEIGMLKVKSGVWGVIGGVIPVTIAIIIAAIKGII